MTTPTLPTPSVQNPEHDPKPDYPIKSRCHNLFLKVQLNLGSMNNLSYVFLIYKGLFRSFFRGHLFYDNNDDKPKWDPFFPKLEINIILPFEIYSLKAKHSRGPQYPRHKLPD